MGWHRGALSSTAPFPRERVWRPLGLFGPVPAAVRPNRLGAPVHPIRCGAVPSGARKGALAGERARRGAACSPGLLC